MGCGIRVNSLSSDDLAEALSTAVTDKVMQERAAKIGEKIRAENGVANAIAVSFLIQAYSHLWLTTASLPIRCSIYTEGKSSVMIPLQSIS